MSSRLRSSLVGSVAVHATIGGLAFVAYLNLPPPRPDPASLGIEVDLVAAPAPPPRPAAPTPVEPPHPANTPPRPAVQTHAVADRSAHRVVPTAPEQQPETPSTGTIEPPTPAVPPTTQSPQPQPTGQPRILTAAELMNTNDRDALAAMRAGGVVLGPADGGPRRSRDLFGQPRTGTPDERARAAAMAPVLAALAESNHMQPAGAGEHDRRVARRAEEAFFPVRTVANLGAAVMRAPTVSMAVQQHTPSAQEMAANDGLDFAHGNTFTMAPVFQTPPPPVHTLRAEVEVDQDRQGTVLATRVVQPSGMPTFDAAAIAALREAIPQGSAMQMQAGRRSRWSFEVSEAVGAVGQALGGGNDGWRMMSESSNGVRLRYRVRMVGAHSWQGS
jgi:hypothetical protein